MNILNNFTGIPDIITDIKLYKFNIYATKKFSFGTWTSRQHVFLQITAASETGYGENIITVNTPDVSLKEWQDCLKQLKGKSVSDSIVYLRQKIGVWQDRLTEMTEMCLVDLAGKLTGKSALELLDLEGRKPVYGVYVILSDNLEFVDDRARWAVAHNKDYFIKVKLFGNNLLDKSVIETVRKNVSQKTFLIGDVNGGYKMHDETATTDEIAQQLAVLYNAGLNACEDPAYISNWEWVDLQDKTDLLCKPGQLSLIPDYPMRPAKKAINTILDGMGRIYNIHPGSAGSIIDAIALAYKIQSMGAKLMIGDDSLVGPGCSIWQQLAVGLQADWVEATEKEKESDFYYDSVIQLATDSTQAPVAINLQCKGFGIYLDTEKLKSTAAEVIEV